MTMSSTRTTVFALCLAVVLALAAPTGARADGVVGDACMLNPTPLCQMLEKKWAIGAQWKAGNGAQVAKGFTAGGQLQPAHGGGYQGHQAIGEFFNAYLLSKFSGARFQPIEAGYTDNTPGKETAFERGAYYFTGAVKNETGNYFVIWKNEGAPGVGLQRHVLMTHDGDVPVIPAGIQNHNVPVVPSGATPATMLNVTETFEQLFFLRSAPTQANFGQVYQDRTLIMASEHAYFDLPQIKAFYGGLIQQKVSAISIVLTEFYAGPTSAYFAATGTFRMISGAQGAIEGPTLKSGSIMLIGYTDRGTGVSAWARQFTLTNKL